MRRSFVFILMLMLVTALSAEEPKKKGFLCNGYTEIFRGEITLDNCDIQDGTYYAWIFWKPSKSEDKDRKTNDIHIQLHDLYSDAHNVIQLGSSETSPMLPYIKNLHYVLSGRSNANLCPIKLTFHDKKITHIWTDDIDWLEYDHYWSSRLHGHKSGDVIYATF